MGKFRFWQCARKLPENLEKKKLFYKSYFEEGNINLKPLILSHYKLITKFRQKKMGKFYFGQSVPKK